MREAPLERTAVWRSRAVEGGIKMIGIGSPCRWIMQFSSDNEKYCFNVLTLIIILISLLMCPWGMKSLASTLH